MIFFPFCYFCSIFRRIVSKSNAAQATPFLCLSGIGRIAYSPRQALSRSHFEANSQDPYAFRSFATKRNTSWKKIFRQRHHSHNHNLNTFHFTNEPMLSVKFFYETIKLTLSLFPNFIHLCETGANRRITSKYFIRVSNLIPFRNV
jgi:hypothetical protein